MALWHVGPLDPRNSRSHGPKWPCLCDPGLKVYAALCRFELENSTREERNLVHAFQQIPGFLTSRLFFFIGKSQPFLRKSMDLLVYKVCIQILGLIYIIYMYIYITLYICIYIYIQDIYTSIHCLFVWEEFHPVPRICIWILTILLRGAKMSRLFMLFGHFRNRLIGGPYHRKKAYVRLM